MKLIELTGRSRWYYVHLVPNEFQPLMNDPARTMIGAYFVKEQLAFPMGVMILSNSKSDEQTLDLDWLYVDEKCRNNGVGYGLLECAFTIAKENGKTTIEAKVIQTEENTAQGDPEDYLSMCGFRWSGYMPFQKERGSRCSILRADASYLDEAEKEAAFFDRERERCQKALSMIPREAKVIDVEYFSGVEIAEG